LDLQVENLLKSYLHEWKIRVKVQQAHSQWSQIGNINSGVQHDSILGPLLFLLYINDLKDVVEHSLLRLGLTATKRPPHIDGRMDRWMPREPFYKLTKNHNLIKLSVTSPIP
jgi:hypothetical protein